MCWSIQSSCSLQPNTLHRWWASAGIMIMIMMSLHSRVMVLPLTPHAVNAAVQHRPMSFSRPEAEL